MDKVRGALEQAGTSMDDIVKTVLYLKHVEDYPRVEEKRQEYYRKYAPSLAEEPPTDTLIGVTALHEADMLIEVDVIALVPE